MNHPRSQPFEPMLNEFLADPEKAALYLEEALALGDIDYFKECIKQVALVQGSIAELSKKTGLGRESLYKTLSRSGNPKLDTLTNILSAVGLRLSITPITQNNSPL